MEDNYVTRIGGNMHFFEMKWPKNVFFMIFWGVLSLNGAFFFLRLVHYANKHLFFTSGIQKIKQFQECVGYENVYHKKQLNI